MKNQNVYRLNEDELRRIIAEAVFESLDTEEWTYKDPFGVKTRRDNRVNAIKYARLYGPLVQRVQAIADEITRRTEILQGSGQVNEAAGAVAKTGLKLFTKAGAEAFAKKAGTAVGIAGLASIPAFLVGPQNISGYLQKFNTNRAQATPQEVIAAYGELASWMQNICSVLQEKPEIIGAAALQDSTLNGPEEVESGPMFDVGDVVETAAGIGVFFIPYVGPILGAIDLVHSLVHAGAAGNRDGLKVVEKQYQYLNKAIVDIEGILQKSNNPALLQQAKGQQQQQYQGAQQTQQQTQARPMPNGYVIGRPAPFASSDLQQVQRLQTYLGLQATGQWDRNTQNAWDNWLRRTYPTQQSVGRTAGNVGKAVGRAVASAR